MLTIALPLFHSCMIVCSVPAQVEKLSNSHNRAFAVEVTTSSHQLCLSADEQTTLDKFVFLLQTQVRLRESISGKLCVFQALIPQRERNLGWGRGEGGTQLNSKKPFSKATILEK